MRLIDADELINDITECKNGFIGTHFEVVVHDEKCDYAIDMIESAETVDNMKRGHWKKDCINDCARCSNCGRSCCQMAKNYCAYCGAEMERSVVVSDLEITKS